MAPKITYTYFDFAGPAESVHLALAMSGEEWENNRITAQQLVALKPTLPYGQLPTFEVDGKVICQTLSILRYVGKLAGIYPTDALEAAYADMAADAVIDSHLNLYPTKVEQDPAKKLSTGDLAVVCRLEWFNSGTLDGILAGIMDGYPLLCALMERVYEEPRIMAYKQKRATAAAAAAAAAAAK